MNILFRLIGAPSIPQRGVFFFSRLADALKVPPKAHYFVTSTFHDPVLLLLLPLRGLGLGSGSGSFSSGLPAAARTSAAPPKTPRPFGR